jgi:hypothetical protein
MGSPAALYCVVWKDNCSNMSAVSYGLVKCELCLYWINILYIIRHVCVDHVWLTSHLWKSEYTVCAGWVIVVIMLSSSILVFIYCTQLDYCKVNGITETNTFLNYNSLKYRDWLRTGRPRGRRSSPAMVKNFHFSISTTMALGPTYPVGIRSGKGAGAGVGKAAGPWSWPLTSN